MVDTVIVNNLTDTLSVSVSKCEMALDTIAVQVTNKSDAVDTFCGMPIEVAQFIVPALISLLGALIVFGIGECWKSRREQKRKLKKYMSTSQTIRTYVEVLNVEADKLVWQIRKYMSDSIGNKSMLPNAIDFDNIAVACLKHYSVGELTLIYVTNRDGDIAQKSKYLNNVQSSIDYLSTVINEMRDFYEESYKKATYLAEQWNTYELEMRKLLLQWIKKANTIGGRNTGDVLQHYSDLTNPFYKDGYLPKDWDARDWYDMVYSPMLDWWVTTHTAKRDEELYSYEDNLIKICRVFKQRSALMEDISKRFGKYADHIDKANKTLKDGIDALDDNKFVKLRNIE